MAVDGGGLQGGERRGGPSAAATPPAAPEDPGPQVGPGLLHTTDAPAPPAASRPPADSTALPTA